MRATEEVVRFFLLAVDLPEEGARITTLSFHMINRGQQHAAGAAGGVVDRLAFLRIEDLDHHPHHAAGV